MTQKSVGITQWGIFCRTNSYQFLMLSNWSDGWFLNAMIYIGKQNMFAPIAFAIIRNSDNPMKFGKTVDPTETDWSIVCEKQDSCRIPNPSLPWSRSASPNHQVIAGIAPYPQQWFHRYIWLWQFKSHFFLMFEMSCGVYKNLCPVKISHMPGKLVPHDWVWTTPINAQHSTGVQCK